MKVWTPAFGFGAHVSKLSRRVAGKMPTWLEELVEKLTENH